MARYWVIAPVESKNPQLFTQVWGFDLANNLISIGWNELGDVSKMISREAIFSASTAALPDRPNTAKGLISNMLWQFYHDIKLGDFVIARRGRKTIAAVGKVIRTGFYEVGKNPFLKPPGYTHGNFLEVEWLAQPRDKVFETIVFPMYTVSEIPADEYRRLVEDGTEPPPPRPEPREAIDQSVFVLEKYLEDFIVTNFATIFKGKMNVYEDADGHVGQQYTTEVGAIDILAFEPGSSSFVVIELKKGRPSDQVVGQILRYMGWVNKNLCKEGQGVRGLVICKNADEKLSYALEMTNNIAVQYYAVSFSLRETP
jgi:restriction system protein